MDHSALWKARRAWPRRAARRARRPGLRWRCASGGVALAAVFALLGAVPAPAAAFTEPGYTGTFADFANCNVLLPDLKGCLHAYLTGGVIALGSASVPISVPGDTLDLPWYTEGAPACEAIDALEDAPGEACLVTPPYGLFNGPAQPVPGGMLGSLGGEPLTGVQARIEWATPLAAETVFGTYQERGFPDPTMSLAALDEGTGVGLRLAVTVHLTGPLLGPDCFIGSPSEPLRLDLTTGSTSPPSPAVPITGTTPLVSVNPSGEVLEITNMVLVDNTFTVPAAHGCGSGEGGLLDAAIDQKLGLPAAAGHSTVILDTLADQSSARAIRRYRGEKTEQEEVEEQEEREEVEREELEQRETEGGESLAVLSPQPLAPPALAAGPPTASVSAPADAAAPPSSAAAQPAHRPAPSASRSRCRPSARPRRARRRCRRPRAHGAQHRA